MKINQKSILFFISSIAEAYSNIPAFIIRRKIKREIVTYSEIKGYIERAEAFFTQSGISPQSKVLIWGTNCPEYAMLLLSCFSLGRTAVPIDYRNSEETITKIIDKTKPRYAYVSKYFKSTFLKKKGITIFYIEDFFNILAHVQPSKTFEKLLQEPLFHDPDHIAEIVFTSGTTGIPKGVVMYQRNLLDNMRMVREGLPELKDGRLISVLPLSHMYEQIIGLFLATSYGAHIYYLPRINSFRLLEAFKEYKPTHQLFVPQLLKIMWDKIEDRARDNGQLRTLHFALRIALFMPKRIKKWIFKDIHALLGGKIQFVACGGAPLEKYVGENWIKVGIDVLEGYGATEVTAAATMNHIGDIRIGTVGKSLKGVTLRVDENGEIYINSPTITGGYYDEPEKTAQAFTKNGYKTGDIGEIDHEGYVHIKGRDVFKIVLRSGEKVYVEDVEFKILQDERVKEACVVGLHEGAGDVVHAYFILRKTNTSTLKDIVGDINNRLESKQQIIRYALWNASDFPRTPTLKIDRKQVSEVAHNKLSMDKAISSQQHITNIQNIVDVISKVSKVPLDKIKDNNILASDLKMDSLSRVELVSMAEEYLGVLIDESKIDAKTTVGDIKHMVKEGDTMEQVEIPTWHLSKLARVVRIILLQLIFIPIHRVIITLRYPQKSVPTIKPGSVVIFNHPGVADGLCIVRTLLKQHNSRYVLNATASVWRAKSSLTHIFELLFSAIPLYESGYPFIKVMQLNADLLDKKYTILFAPQGRNQRSDKEDAFLPGIGYMIKELQCPVHIIKINGYREIWPAPATNVLHSSIQNLLPKKRGVVDILVSPLINNNWTEMKAQEITALLQKKYNELSS